MAEPKPDIYLHVVVVDEKDNTRTPGSNDKVEVNGSRLKHDAKKGFVYKIKKGNDDFGLRIGYQGFAELRQWFLAEGEAGNHKLTPYWPGTNREVVVPEDGVCYDKTRKNYLLECITLHRSKGGYGAKRSPLVYTVTVKLCQTKEYVAGIGTDYWEGNHKSGLPFASWAATFAKHLSLRKLLNVSSPFTMIDCQRGVEERWMRARRKGWRRQYLLAKRTAAPTWPRKRHFDTWRSHISNGTIPISRYFGATDMYHYLSSKGRDRPGTVIEFAVFSHGWWGGPILFNTMDNVSGNARSTTDLDMRHRKDFRAPNTNKWSSMPAAFAAGANIHIGGCFATTIIRSALWYLMRKAKYLFRWRGWGNYRADGIRTTLNHIMDNFNYMAAIARYTGRTTYGAPPGFGSDGTTYRKLPGLYAQLSKGLTDAKEKRKLRKKLRRTRGSTFYIPRTVLKKKGRRVYKTGPRKMYEGFHLGTREFNVFGHMRYDP